MSPLPTNAIDRFVDFVTPNNLTRILVGLVVLKVAQVVYIRGRRVFSPLRHLKGPENPSLIAGNMKEIFVPSGFEIFDRWAAQYGRTFQFRGTFLSYRLLTTDLRAINFIMSQTNLFPKSDEAQQNLSAVLGRGVLLAEGDVHKRQRRVMNPAFGPNQLRRLVPIFWEKSNKLKDLWLDTIKSSTHDATTIDVLSWLSRATLDVIGAAGFDYDFNSLQGDECELAQALSKIFSSSPPRTTFSVIRNLVPILKLVPTKRDRMLNENMAIMQRIGRGIITEKKELLSQELKTGSAAQSRDLLTLLIKANMTSESEESRMTDEEVLGQITTFIVAGHETTSTSTTWALYALAKYPKVQRQLRQELLESELGDEPDMDSLDKLPYLDKFVRECLRVYAPVSIVARKASQHVQVPVSNPYKDRYGVSHDQINLAKDDLVLIPISSMNRLREVWGEDASEFRPERWDSLPATIKEMPGVWAHMMTFASGSRACIGFRFAVIEMKALLYTLVRAIDFDIDPSLRFENTPTAVTRPRVASGPEKRNGMPLICKAVSVPF